LKLHKEEPLLFWGKSEEAVLNRAYGGFLFLGLITLPLGLGGLLSALHLMNFDEGSGGAGEWLAGWTLYLGLLLGLPAFAGMIVATLNGIRQTVRFRHRALVVLSGISIVCAGGLIVVMAMDGDPDRPIVAFGLDTAFGTYIASNVLIPAWWFLKGRRLYRSQQFSPE
jgi:hypothetical protein